MKKMRDVMIAVVIMIVCFLDTSLAQGQAITLDVTYTDDDRFGFEEGFFDLSLGQARRDAFQKALDIWAKQLQGTVTVHVEAQFNPLGPALNGRTTIFRAVANLSGLPEPGFGYVAPLASQLTNTNIVGLPGSDHPGFHIFAEFNSDKDTNPVGGGRFDYTTTSKPNPGDKLFLATALHELGHGFGFGHLLTLIFDPNPPGNIIGLDFTNGVPLILMKFVHERRADSTTEDFVDMNDAERLIAATGDRAFYKGPAIVAAAIPNPDPIFISDPANPPINTFNEAKLFSPATFVLGSTLAHWDSEHGPDGRSLLMSPGSRSQFNIDYTREVMQDIGWNLQTVPEIQVSPDSLRFQSTGVGAGPSPPLTVTITNTGSVDLDLISIELEDSSGDPGSAANFSITTGNTQGAVAPAQSRDVTVVFNPTTSGFKTAFLRVLSSDTHQWSEFVITTGSAIAGTSAQVWVDFVFAGDELGTQTQPFNSAIEGSIFVTAGGTVNIRPGVSPETLTINKAMTLVNAGAAARGALPSAVRIGDPSTARSASMHQQYGPTETGFISRPPLPNSRQK